MDSKIIAYIICILGGIIAAYFEYSYKKSVKKDKDEESVARNITSIGIYFFIILAIYAAIMLFIKIY
jgi:hypothetical protein